MHQFFRFSFFSAFRYLGCAIFFIFLLNFVALSDDLYPYVSLPMSASGNARSYGTSIQLSDDRLMYLLVSGTNYEYNTPVISDFARLAFYYRDSNTISYVAYVPESNYILYPPANSSSRYVLSQDIYYNGSRTSTFLFNIDNPQILLRNDIDIGLYHPLNYIIYASVDDAYNAIVNEGSGSSSNIVYDPDIDVPSQFKFTHNGLTSILSNLVGIGASGTVVWSNTPGNSVFCRLLATIPGDSSDFYIPLVDFDDYMLASSGSYSIYRTQISNVFDQLYPDNHNIIADQFTLRDLRLQFFTYDTDSGVYNVSPISVINVNNHGILGMYSNYITSLYYPLSMSDIGVSGGFGYDFYSKWTNTANPYIAYGDDDAVISTGSVTQDINNAITSNISNTNATNTFNYDYSVYQYNISIGGGTSEGGSTGIDLPDLYGLLIGWMRDFAVQLANLESIISNVFSAVSDLAGSVPDFFADAFSFLPVEFSSLLMMSISICVILRFLGR